MQNSRHELFFGVSFAETLVTEETRSHGALYPIVVPPTKYQGLILSMFTCSGL